VREGLRYGEQLFTSMLRDTREGGEGAAPSPCRSLVHQASDEGANLSERSDRPLRGLVRPRVRPVEEPRPSRAVRTRIVRNPRIGEDRPLRSASHGPACACDRSGEPRRGELAVGVGHMEEHPLFRDDVVPRIVLREQEGDHGNVATAGVQGAEVVDNGAGRSLAERRQLAATLASLDNEAADLQGHAVQVHDRLAAPVAATDAATAAPGFHAGLRRQVLSQPRVDATAREQAEGSGHEVRRFLPNVGRVEVAVSVSREAAIAVHGLNGTDDAARTGYLEEHRTFSE